MRKLFVTGGTGFVGRGILPMLLDAGDEVHALVRNGSEKKLPQHPALHVFLGDVRDEQDIERALYGCDTIIHLAGIKRKEIKKYNLSYEEIDYKSVVAVTKIAEKLGVPKIILLSAALLGNSTYVQVKRKCEGVVKQSSLSWTILEPSFIIAPGQQWPVLLTLFLSLLLLVPGKLGAIAKRASNITREELGKTILWALQNNENVFCDVPKIKSLIKLRASTGF